MQTLLANILQFIGIANIIKVYELYIIVRDWILSYITTIIVYFVKNNDDQLISVIFKSSDYQINLPLDLNLDKISNKISNNLDGYLEIKYFENNKEYIQLIPWNQKINDDIELVSQNKLFIKLLKPVEILFAIDSQGNDLTEIVSRYSPHLNEYSNCPTKMINDMYGISTTVLKDIKLENIRSLIPELGEDKIEILTENGLTIHV